MTHGSKGREEAARACRDLSPVPLGPSLRLLAPQDGTRDVGQITGPGGSASL